MNRHFVSPRRPTFFHRRITMWPGGEEGKEGGGWQFIKVEYHRALISRWNANLLFMAELVSRRFSNFFFFSSPPSFVCIAHSMFFFFLVGEIYSIRRFKLILILYHRGWYEIVAVFLSSVKARRRDERWEIDRERKGIVYGG